MNDFQPNTVMMPDGEVVPTEAAMNNVPTEDAGVRFPTAIKIEVEQTQEWKRKLGNLNEATTVAVNSVKDEYSRGLANGLILAVSTLVGKEPAFIEAIDE